MDANDQSTGDRDDSTIKKDNKIAVENTDKEPSISMDKSEVIPVDDKTSESSELRLSKDTNLEKEKQFDEKNVHYENGVCVYTDPESKCQFIWDGEKQEWLTRNNPSLPLGKEDYDYDGQTYVYTDKETNIKYSWDPENSVWKVTECKLDKIDENVPMKEVSKIEDEKNGSDENTLKDVIKQDMTKGHYGYENDTHTYTDFSDGTKYCWNKEKNAWFPKVDDEFLAQYQMNYGFVDPNENESTTENKKPEPPPFLESDSLKRKAPQEPAWFDVGEESTKVYVSGLPLDITETEFLDVMQKCGLVMRELNSGKMKIKIYLDPETSLPKGDALCSYIKKESVDLALNLLDGYDVRGHRITVERAKFTMKGNAYDPSLKPKKKRKKDKEKLKKIQEKLFDWRPDKMRGERSRHEKIVIVKNLFEPDLFNKDVKLILEYQQDLREECLKCGAVKKVTIYDRHPEGVAQIIFKEFEAADACVQLLNGRWFGQRKIVAEIWDGKTKYKISETDEEIKARLAKWEKFLEAGEAANKGGIESKLVDTNVKENKEENNGEVSPTKDLKTDSVKISLDSEKVKEESDEIKRDSDQDTRSSVGSDYETDDEVKTSQ